MTNGSGVCDGLLRSPINDGLFQGFWWDEDCDGLLQGVYDSIYIAVQTNTMTALCGLREYFAVLRFEIDWAVCREEELSRSEFSTVDIVQTSVAVPKCPQCQQIRHLCPGDISPRFCIQTRSWVFYLWSIISTSYLLEMNDGGANEKERRVIKECLLLYSSKKKEKRVQAVHTKSNTESLRMRGEWQIDVYIKFR